MIIKKMVLIFLFICLSYSFANESKKELTLFTKETINIEIDSLKIYDELISQENRESSYEPNVAGIIVGGALLGFGTFAIGMGYYLLYEYSNSKDWGNEFAAKMEGVLCFLSGGILSLIGIPVLSYNIYQYNVHKNHANKRDEYQNALDRYKLQKQQKKSSIKVIMFPSFDFENHGGKINTTILF